MHEISYETIFMQIFCRPGKYYCTKYKTFKININKASAK